MQKEREKIADDVFYNIPPDKERKKMSPRELAKLLSKCEKDSPEYILLEHELNIRIAKVQARPVYFSVLMTLVGIIFGWLLGQWKPL